jgi:hypothetical protein
MILAATYVTTAFLVFCWNHELEAKPTIVPTVVPEVLIYDVDEPKAKPEVLIFDLDETIAMLGGEDMVEVEVKTKITEDMLLSKKGLPLMGAARQARINKLEREGYVA